MAAVRAGDLEAFRSLIAADPSLAISRSTKSHSTLLQCVVLDGKDRPHNVEMAAILIDAGAELNEPMIATGSINNRAVAELLLDHGALVDGTGGWSPLEEALYWNSHDVITLLLERGAKVLNLRIAAGLGRKDLIENFFDAGGTLKPEAGKIDWPFGDLKKVAQSNHDEAGKKILTDSINSWSQQQQQIVNNAFVYGCMHGHIDTAQLLMNKGAEINAIPPGFDYAGTGLHYAALNGHRTMVEFLLAHGANREIKDTKVGSTAAGWAEHGKQDGLLDLLS
jgi:ankyrin repeat protein